MRVALISLARRGGMVHFLAEVADALAALTDTTVVVSSVAELDYLTPKATRIRVNTGRNPIGSLVRFVNPTTWYGLLRSLRCSDAHMVHILGAHQWNPALVVLCRLLGKPLVYTVHDPESHPGAPWPIRIGDWITTRLADKVVTLTRHGQRQLLRRGIRPNRITVIPHPMYSLFLRRRRNTSTPSRTILYFGRVEAYKGLEILVEAFRSARQRLKGWSLIIAGSGILPPSMLQGTHGDIRILNRYLSDHEVARLMRRAAIVALPYRSATQSGVIALAQAFARPVVATAVGGLREMVVQGKSGILVPPDDAGALARALIALGNDKARCLRMQHYITAQVDAAWQPHNVARAHLRMYSDLLGKGTRK